MTISTRSLPRFKVFIILTLLIGKSLLADEFKIELSDEVKKKFPAGFPLQVSSERMGEQVLVKVTNLTKKFLAITKQSPGFSRKDIFPEEKKEPTKSGVGILMDPMHLDHIVISPSNHRFGSTRVIAKYPGTHAQAVKCEISFSVGGIFPPAEGYIMFSINGEFDYKSK